MRTGSRTHRLHINTSVNW